MPWTRETAESDRIIVQLDREIEDIVPGFLDRRLEDVESLLEALEQGDFEAIGMLGHRMKGSGGGYGFDVIGRIGGSLERAAQEADSGHIQGLVEELASYLERVEVVYQ